MLFESYKILFTEKALGAGFTQQNIDDCLEYAKPLIDKNLPVIYNTSHLAGLVGYHKDYLKKAALNTKYYYRFFQVRKKNGTTRLISEPLPSLKEIQYWVLREILERVKVSTFAKAYRPNISIKENLRYHVGQPVVLSIDVKDFFPSISQEKIEKIFLTLGYSKIVSNLFSKLCTLNESLPQGAPTSPYLSNLFFASIDVSISRYCKTISVRYTRYADDLTFSGNFDPKLVTDFIEGLIVSAGLELNHTKTRVMTPNIRQTVTGVVVNDKMQVDFRKRNKLRQTIYYIKKFGLANHMAHEKITKRNYLDHLLGKINFILHLNPSDKEFFEYRSYLRQLKEAGSQ